MGGRHQVQRHIAVDAAVKGKVRLLGVNSVVVAVVNGHGQKVVFPQFAGDVHAERRIAALVLGHGFAVQAHGGAHGGTVKLQYGTAARGDLGLFQRAGIAAGAAVIVVAAVLSVRGVPGVGQGHGFVPPLLAEGPARVVQ